MNEGEGEPCWTLVRLHPGSTSTILPRFLFWGVDFILRLRLRDETTACMLYGTPSFQSMIGCRVPYETPIFLSQENMLKQAQRPSKTGCPSSRHSRWPVDRHLIFHAYATATCAYFTGFIGARGPGAAGAALSCMPHHRGVLTFGGGGGCLFSGLSGNSDWSAVSNDCVPIHKR